MTYERFYDVRKELEAAGKTFCSVSLKRLRFGDLMLAGFGNAGSTICSHELVQEEEQRRLDEALQGLVLENLDGVEWEDGSMRYAAYRRFAPERMNYYDGSVAVRLYWVTTCIRGHWRDASERLDIVRELCTQALQEEVLPANWVLACRKLADEVFDGHFNDGRVFRDGCMIMDDEIVEALGLPEQFASGVSGNLAKMLGAKKICHRGSSGSYEDIWEHHMTPLERAEALCRKVDGIPWYDDCGCYV